MAGRGGESAVIRHAHAATRADSGTANPARRYRPHRLAGTDARSVSTAAEFMTPWRHRRRGQYSRAADNRRTSRYGRGQRSSRSATGIPERERPDRRIGMPTEGIGIYDPGRADAPVLASSRQAIDATSSWPGRGGSSAFQRTDLPRPEQARRRTVGRPGHVSGTIKHSEPIWTVRSRACHRLSETLKRTATNVSADHATAGRRLWPASRPEAKFI